MSGGSDSTRWSLEAHALRFVTVQKSRFPGCVLFVAMGEGYALFDDDAVTVHEVLGVALDQHPLGFLVARVPRELIERSLQEVVGAGYRVAVCESRG